MTKSLCCAAVVAAVAGVASAGFIDFETVPGVGLPVDDMNIENAYNSAAFDFVTFSVLTADGMADAVFEARGSDDDDGFVNALAGENDVDNPLPVGVPGLGNFFLRDGSDFQNTGKPLSLFITYNEAHSGVAPTTASGQIWDIDGVDGTNTERWEVYVTDVLGNTTLADTSPEGLESDGPLDGLPWAFVASDADGIAQIELRFTGTKDSGLGVAFDNFRTDGIIPAPGTVALAGLGGLAFARRRR